MILTPGSVFFYSGLLLLVFGNTFGVILALLMIFTAFWLWQKEDQGYLDYDDEDDEFVNGVWAILHGDPWPGDPLQVFPDEASARDVLRGCEPECQLLVRGANEWLEVPRVTFLKP